MSEHIVSRKIYFAIFAALMVLTVVTVLAARQDFGRFNDIIAMGIAVLKATLVILFFMHVRYSSRLTKVVVVAGFFWLAIFVVLTLSDYLTRASGPADRTFEEQKIYQHKSPSGH
jgi:cytochrome c oxidase subunit 4